MVAERARIEPGDRVCDVGAVADEGHSDDVPGVLVVAGMSGMVSGFAMASLVAKAGAPGFRSLLRMRSRLGVSWGKGCRSCVRDSCRSLSAVLLHRTGEYDHPPSARA